MVTDIADKWGEQIAARGFAQIPNYLLLLNQFLGDERKLSPLELLIVIQLVGAWWKKEAMPFPSMATLAQRCGVSDRQIQRSINHLVKSELIVRTKRTTTTGVRSNNSYDLQPMIALLNEVAKAYPNGYPRNVATVRTRKSPFSAVVDPEGAAFFEAAAEVEAEAKAIAGSKGGVSG